MNNDTTWDYYSEALVTGLQERNYSSTALVLSVIVARTFREEDREGVLEDILEILKIAKNEKEFKDAIWQIVEEAREEFLEAEEEE